MAAIDDIRQELIETGQATKVLLDYVDDRIESQLAALMINRLGDIEENLMERLNHEKSI